MSPRAGCSQRRHSVDYAPNVGGGDIDSATAHSCRASFSPEYRLDRLEVRSATDDRGSVDRGSGDDDWTRGVRVEREARVPLW